MRSRLLAAAAAGSLLLGSALTLALAPPAAALTATDIGSGPLKVRDGMRFAVPEIEDGLGQISISPNAPTTQQFTAAATGPLDSITVQIASDDTAVTAWLYASGDVSVHMDIWNDVLVLGTPLATATVPDTGGGQELRTVSADFSSAPLLRAGTKYWVVFSTTEAGTAPIIGSTWHASGPELRYYSTSNGEFWSSTYSQSLAVDVFVTPPVQVTLDPAEPDGENGWHVSDVTATYTCHESVDECPEPKTFDTDGTHTPSGTATLDDGATIFPWKHTVKVDKTAPTGYFTIGDPDGDDGWFTELPDITSFEYVSDPTSGVDVASLGTPAEIASSTHTQMFVPVKDQAGNQASLPSEWFKYDSQAPTVEQQGPFGGQGDNGWYTSPVSIAWSCGDHDTNNSGLAYPYCPDGESLTDGEHEAVEVSQKDNAGNETVVTRPAYKVDTIDPTITGTSEVVAGGFKVTWSCTDGGSGVATCPSPTTVTGKSGHTVATATARDNAGNEKTGEVTGLVAGNRPPTVTIDGVVGGSTHPHGTVLTPSCTATSRSTHDPQSLTCTGSTASVTDGDGSTTHTYTATATDDAVDGGTTTETVSWTVAAAAPKVEQPKAEQSKTKASISVKGLPKKHKKNGASVLERNRTYTLKIVLRDKSGKIVKGKPTWLRSVATNKSGTKGRPTLELIKFRKVGRKWVTTFTPGDGHQGYRKFGVVAADGTKHHVVVFVK